MRCSRCQAENRQGLRFCEDCGARLSTTCPSCGAEVTYDKRFCGDCGTPLGVLESRFPSPEIYTPKHLAEKILTSKAALEGERKQVTVLFADMKGSMELLADRDPEEARQSLDPVLKFMMGAVHQYEGTVNQVMGDGIMALFGAPIAHEDHAVRACYAALRMQEMLKRYADETRRSHGINIQVRVGLNSGEVVVRAIGSDLHMDYTAVGQTTHLAARMEQLASPGSIALTAHTLELAEGFVQVRSLGPVPVKGLGEPVEVYELTGAGPVRRRFEAATIRGLSRFVGREAELDQLRKALERTGQGHGQLVAVVGEPGVGKSRLYYEFTRGHRMHGWLVLEASSVSYGKATLYLPIADLLKGYFQIEARDDPRRVQEKVTGKLLTLDRTLEPTLPALFALLDVPFEDAEWRSLDPPQRRQRTLDAIKRLLLRESQVQPLCLVFEDLHWIDSETQAVLDNLIDSLPTARIVLLVNYRPEYRHGWSSKTYYTQLRIDPLPPESAEELLNALLGTDAALLPLKRLLVERTEGNPFFLEETVRTLAETKILVGCQGAYEMVRSIAGIQIPATVHAVLAARIDRLPPQQKRLLQCGAVIGHAVPFALLQAIAELPEETLRRELLHLQSGEFLCEASIFPELQYTFKHALTHEVVYAGLLQDRRRALHARIVEATEGIYADRLAEHVERLADHATRGELGAKAVTYLQQAGSKAAAHSAYREAVARFTQALAILSRLPQNRETLAEAIDLRFELRNSLFPLGEVQLDLDHLRDAERLAQELGDHRRSAWIAAYLARDFSLLGDQDRAVESGRRASTLATEAGEVGLQILTEAYLGSANFALGRYRDSVHVLQKSVAALEGSRPHERFGLPGPASVFFRIWLLWSLTKLGEFDEASVRAQEAIRIAESVQQPLSRAVAAYGLGYVHLHRGDLVEAAKVLERSLELCRTWGLEAWFPNFASSLGYAYALHGRTSAGISLLEEAIAQTGRLRVFVNHAAEVAWLGEAYLLARRFDDATSTAGHALELARHHRERGNEATALRLLGEIAAQRNANDLGAAEARYREAQALAQDLGMRPLIALCHLGLGRLRQRAGLNQEAEQQFAMARAGLREMGMWCSPENA